MRTVGIWDSKPDCLCVSSFILHPCSGWVPSRSPVGLGQADGPAHSLCTGVILVPPPQAPTYDPCGMLLLAPSPCWQCPPLDAWLGQCPVPPLLSGTAAGGIGFMVDSRDHEPQTLPQGKHHDLLPLPPPPPCWFGAALGLCVALPGPSAAGGMSFVHPAFPQSIIWKQGSHCPHGCLQCCAWPGQWLWWSLFYFPNPNLDLAALPASDVALGWRGVVGSVPLSGIPSMPPSLATCIL